MQYLHKQTQHILAQLRATQSIPVIDDIPAGWDYLAEVLSNNIKQDDIMLMVSLNGAQLYESKRSDCGMRIYTRVEQAQLDSFLFVRMHHLTALQKNGIKMWDASRDAVFTSDLHLLFRPADGLGPVYWDGMVGHGGKNGCCVYCMDYLLMLEMGTCCCENERGTQSTPTGQHALAISTFLCHGQQLPRIRKWARLQLPNGQMARLSWRDKLKPLEKTRMSHNVKIKLNNQIHFAEVLYHTQLPVYVARQHKDDSDNDNEWQFKNVAVMQMYSMPHKELFKLSLQTLISCTLLDDILAIDEPTLPSGVTESWFFMMEQPGLDISILGVPYSGFDAGGGDEAEDDDDDGAELE
ncbi:hypothetical protein P692DRAFT_20867035 [Suillus brevipes Sb2]|nr:hypothetical protein P692DRAFT_20867035 [Suillus brevipes Sb2]